MLEFLNAILWVVAFLGLVAVILTFWFIFVESYNDKTFTFVLPFIISIIIFLGTSYGAFRTQVKIGIIEAESQIESFELVKKQKEELGDSYIIEPTMLTNYDKALSTLNKYKRLGLYKDDYTPKSIEVKIIDETGHNKYCGCSPCECIGECKCTKDYPFPGYERTK